MHRMLRNSDAGPENGLPCRISARFLSESLKLALRRPSAGPRADFYIFPSGIRPKPGRAGNGKHVWFGVLCEHLRAFAWVSQKPVRGRKGAGARTNSPSREPDEAQKALEAQRRERKSVNIHHFLLGERKPSNIHHLLVMD